MTPYVSAFQPKTGVWDQYCHYWSHALHHYSAHNHGRPTNVVTHPQKDDRDTLRSHVVFTTCNLGITDPLQGCPSRQWSAHAETFTSLKRFVQKQTYAGWIKPYIDQSWQVLSCQTGSAQSP